MLYELPSAFIMSVLLVAMLAANEAGRRFGMGRRSDQKAGHKERTNATVASILATVALMLGFTFTMSVQRFDGRSDATMREANAIGTTYLRSQLLSGAEQSDAQQVLARYIAHRIESTKIDMSHPAARRDADREAKRLQSEIWTSAIRAAENDPNPTRSGLFIRALNEMIDSYASRQAALDKHLPAIVLYLLFLMLIIAEVVLGYAGGLAQTQPRVATVSLSVLIVLVLFLVFDLDRPRRGFVQVNQASMLELQELASQTPLGKLRPNH